MNEATSRRVAGWSGVLFAVLSGVILVLAPFWPPLGASAAEVVAFYSAHRLPFLIGNALAVFAAVPSFALLGWLTVALKKAEGEGGWLWLAFFGSGVFSHAVGAAVLITYQVVPFELDAPAVAKGFNDLAGAGFACFQFVLLAHSISATWAYLATGLFPRWVALLGVGVTALCLAAGIGSVWAEPAFIAGGGLLSCISTGAFVGWTLLVSLLVLRKR